MKLNIADIFKFAPMVIQTVKAVQGAFGDKPGAEKKEKAIEAVNGAIDIVDALKDPDLDPVKRARILDLSSEAIEIGVEVMKLEKRIEAIGAEIKALKASKAA